VTETAACAVCGSTESRVFFEQRGVPVQDGLLWPTPEAARTSPVGDIRLSFCEDCGFVGNRAYETGKVRFQPGYDISLHHSPRYRAFVEAVAADLVARHALRGKDVLEIACGNGDFLRRVCALGGNRGVGFDPSLTPEAIARGAAEGLALRAETLPREGAGAADLVCCRHVLQSMPAPRAFVGDARRALSARPGTVYYFEVPDASPIFRDLAVWTIIYETCSYFTETSLTRLFELEGFRVRRTASLLDGAYLGLEASDGGESPARAEDRSGRAPAVAGLAAEIAAFERRFGELRARWRSDLSSLRGRRVAAWGAGGRAIAFFTLFAGVADVPWVVDINPKRQGLYLPQTAQRVVPPEFLREFRPDAVLVTNPTFAGEIRESIHGLGLSPEILTL
jgi:SAM-dependent methyltransferase